jgi:hypothetical protein
VRIDVIGDPARERKAAAGESFHGQQGVIEATQPHADHQHYRQREPRGKPRGVGPGTERHAEASDAFHDDDVRRGGERVETALDMIQIDSDSRFGCREVRRNRRRETLRIDLLARGRRVARREQPLDVLVNETVPARDGARRDRLHAHRPQSALGKRLEQAAGDKGLADAGVRSRYEEPVSGAC